MKIGAKFVTLRNGEIPQKVCIDVHGYILTVNNIL